MASPGPLPPEAEATEEHSASGRHLLFGRIQHSRCGRHQSGGLIDNQQSCARSHSACQNPARCAAAISPVEQSGPCRRFGDNGLSEPRCERGQPFRARKIRSRASRRFASLDGGKYGAASPSNRPASGMPSRRPVAASGAAKPWVSGGYSPGGKSVEGARLVTRRAEPRLARRYKPPRHRSPAS